MGWLQLLRIMLRGWESLIIKSGKRYVMTSETKRGGLSEAN